MADEGIVVPVTPKLQNAGQFESEIRRLFASLGNVTNTAATGRGGLTAPNRGEDASVLSRTVAVVKEFTALLAQANAKGFAVPKAVQTQYEALQNTIPTVVNATREGRSPSQAGRLQRAAENQLAADTEYAASLKAATRVLQATTAQQERVGAESALFAGEVGKGRKAANVLPGAVIHSEAETQRLQEQARRDAQGFAAARASYTPEHQLSDADLAPRALVEDARKAARAREAAIAKDQLRALEDANLLPIPLPPKGAKGGEFDYATNLDPALRRSKYVGGSAASPDNIQDWLDKGFGQAGGFSPGQGGGDIGAFANHVNDLRLLANGRGAPSEAAVADILKSQGLGAPFASEITPIVASSNDANIKTQAQKVAALQQQLRQSALAQQARELAQFGTAPVEEEGSASVRASRENVLRRRAAQEQRGLAAVTTDAATLEALAHQDREDAEDAQVAGRARARKLAADIPTLGQSRQRGLENAQKEDELEKLRQEYLKSYQPPGGGGRGPGGPHDPPYVNPESGGDDEAGYHAAVQKVREALNTRYNSILESLIKEQVLSQEYGALISATGELAAFRRSNAARENAVTEEALAADKLYIKAQADAAVAKRVSSALSKEQELASVKAFPGLTALEGSNAAGSRLEAARIGIKEQQILGESENLKILAEESALKKINAAAEKRLVEQTLATGVEAERYQSATAEAANLQRYTAAQIKARTQQGVGVGGTAGLAYIEQLEAANNVEARLAKARVSVAENTLLAQEQNLVALAEERASNRQNAAATKVQTALIEKGIFEQGGQSGSFVQRIQAAAKQKDGGDFINPLEQQTGAQLLKSKFLTTATFAVSGVATYAAFSGFQTLLKDSAELERKLSLIKAEFSALGDGSAFSGFKAGILGISRETGTAASEVADIAIRFKGAFSGLSDSGVLTQVRAAVELSKVTGISLQDITNNLTASAVVYGVSIAHVGDAALALQDRTGVSAKEIIQASSDMAVAAENAGATFEQVVALAAVGSKYTGQSGSLVAEGLNRIIPAINSKAGGVVQLIQEAAPKQTQAIVSALAQGEQFKVFDIIGRNYDKLTKSQQAYLISLLGSRRDAKTAIDIFSHYNEVLDGQQAALDSNGRLAKSWSDLQGTLSQQIAKVTAALKSMAAVLLSLGLSDFLQVFAKVLGGVVGIFGEFLGVFAAFNDLAFGIPGKVAAITLGVLALAKAMALVRDAGFLGAVSQAASKIPGGGLVQSATRSAGSDSGIVAGGEKAAVTIGAAMTEAGDSVAAAIALAMREGGALAASEQAAGTALPGGLFIPASRAAERTAATSSLEAAAGVGLGGLEYSASTAETGIKGVFGRISAATSEGGSLLGALGAEIGPALSSFFALLKGFLVPLLPFIVAVEGVLLVLDAFKANAQANAARKAYEDYLITSGKGPTPTPEAQKKKEQEASPDQQAADAYTKAARPSGFSIGDLNPFHLLPHAVKDLVDFGKPTAAQVSERENRASLAQPFAQALQGLSPKELEAALGTQPELQAPGQHVSAKDIANIAAGKSGLKSDKFNALLKIITDASKSNKNIGPAVQKLLGERNKKTKDIADAAQALIDLPTLQIRQELGNIGTTDYLQRVASQRDSTKAVLSQAIRDGAPQDQIKSYKTELDAENTAFAQILDKHVQDLATAGVLAATISGANPADLSKTKIAAGIEALKSAFAIDSPQSIGVAQAIITEQQSLIQYEADHAKTSAEAARILATGKSIDPAVQRVIGKDILTKLPPLQDNALKNVANNLEEFGGDINKVLDFIVSYKGGIKKGLQALANKLAKDVEALRSEGGHATQIKNDLARIRVIRDLANTINVPDEVAAPQPVQPTRQENRAAKDAITKAFVAGNPVASAIEAEREAAVTYQDAVEQYNADYQLSIYAGDNPKLKARAKRAAARLASDLNAKRIAAAGEVDAANQAQDAQAQAAQAAISNAGFSQDPVAAAATAQRLAARQVQDALAKSGGDYNSAAVQQALLAQKQADAQYQDAVNAIPQAQAAVLSAQADGDPVKAAQAAVAAAQAQFAAAHGVAAQLQAIAQGISAQHQLRDALNAVADAQRNIVIATLQAAGKTVEAAKAQQAEDKNAYNRYLAQHPGATKANDATAAGLYQKTITDAASVRDAALQNSLDDINFGLATHKIFNSQAIARLKVLDANQKLTKAEHHQLEEQIYNLQHQNQQDLQFNLPSDIKLPTLYVARRFDEGGGGAGGSHYQDNRKIEIHVSTNAKLDGKDVNRLVDSVTTVVNAPPRFGTRPRTY